LGGGGLEHGECKKGSKRCVFLQKHEAEHAGFTKKEVVESTTSDLRKNKTVAGEKGAELSLSIFTFGGQRPRILGL
jgi:hypothetical protein